MLRRLALAGVLALTVAASASAKGEPRFDRATARVGDTLTLTSPYVGDPVGVVVYLLPLAASPLWWPTYQALAPAYGPPPHLRSAVRVGRVSRWGAHGGRIRFRIPHVVPGRYVLGYWCVPCGTHWTSALPNFQLDRFGILRIRA
jgi:hypothetical protein